jgi:CRP-like cAMP-binding protein
VCRLSTPIVGFCVDGRGAEEFLRRSATRTPIGLAILRTAPNKLRSTQERVLVIFRYSEQSFSEAGSNLELQFASLIFPSDDELKLCFP